MSHQLPVNVAIKLLTKLKPLQETLLTPQLLLFQALMASPMKQTIAISEKTVPLAITPHNAYIDVQVNQREKSLQETEMNKRILLVSESMVHAFCTKTPDGY